MTLKSQFIINLKLEFLFLKNKIKIIYKNKK